MVYLPPIRNLRTFSFASFLVMRKHARCEQWAADFMDRAKRDKRSTGIAKCVRHFLRLVILVIISEMPWVILIHVERGVDNLKRWRAVSFPSPENPWRMQSPCYKKPPFFPGRMRLAPFFAAHDELVNISCIKSRKDNKWIQYTILLFFKIMYSLLLFPNDKC